MSCSSTRPGPDPGAGPYSEDELLPVSGLAHMVFCPRRWALIHLEGVWADNRQTAEGADMHGTVHTDGAEARGEMVVVRALRLRSLALGLAGVSDVVEFHPLPPGEDLTTGCPLLGRPGHWRPMPVEYKCGRPQPDDCYHVQLAGQALCLEEMLGVAISRGYLFHAAIRRRQEVLLDQPLRERTRKLARAMHDLHASGKTPPARYTKKCGGCSLFEACQPKTVARHKSATRHLAAGFASLAGEEGPP